MIKINHTNFKCFFFFEKQESFPNLCKDVLRDLSSSDLPREDTFMVPIFLMRKKRQC